MELERLSAEAHSTLEAILGYLNFSAGATDARFLRNLNEAYRLFLAASDGPGDADPADRPWMRSAR